MGLSLFSDDSKRLAKALKFVSISEDAIELPSGSEFR